MPTTWPAMEEQCKLHQSQGMFTCIWTASPSPEAATTLTSLIITCSDIPVIIPSNKQCATGKKITKTHFAKTLEAQTYQSLTSSPCIFIFTVHSSTKHQLNCAERGLLMPSMHSCHHCVSFLVQVLPYVLCNKLGIWLQTVYLQSYINHNLWYTTQLLRS